ncbi:unnamed protein product [Aphanomyces euteiches]|uniref:DUF962 domain-containing protein n=1 Tax=Aphanomyces euteiches TaxID=100861 RepID=A0A6G0WE41_9STRA|nr:hypothetical protein Ae201684_016721 [Aphanomyces euteiches]KAH9083078.1 hypothetical protein Ae201684P_013979 [Aphanomyces euteiches]KAH9100294.1 hypothetical protein LEN26_015966 [Aphanomyces euteiches]KAH9115174.1 hypothetical protein AeMF1_010788 [Aphanomyces euteiches]KAH9157770.1 hypothetical protein AeRB84_000407 [Aphanomyces euteiches]
MALGFKDKFNLEKQVTFYLSYHSDPINKALHLVCIWPILLSAIYLLNTTTPFIAGALDPSHYFVVNAALVGVIIYALWYMVLDPIAGTFCAGLIVAFYTWSNHFIYESVTKTGESHWQVALIIHVTAWIIQFIGHGVFEKRAPALLESWDQAIITAPLFVALELILPLGYRREMHERVERNVAINVAKFRQQRDAASTKPLVGK